MPSAPLLRRAVALAGLFAWCSQGAPAGAQSAPSPPAPGPAAASRLPAAAEGPPAVTSSNAAGENAAAETDEEGAKARARALYEKGVKAYAEGRYHEAADYFLDTNRIYPTPQLAFNVGKAYDKAGNGAGALRYYRDYLRRAPDAPDRSEVSERIRALELALSERGLQQLSVLSVPEGATVLLDGRPVGVTPWTGETWPGRHRVNLVLAGHERTDDIVELDIHRAAEAQIALVAQRPVTRQSPKPAPSLEPATRVRPLTWVALGAGLAALGTALTIEMATKDEGGLSQGAAFLSGVGVAGAALGGVMLYVDLNAIGR
ncbi:MAG TPA: PEGA domain-containing protein [Polyangiaceae bacterium]